MPTIDNRIIEALRRQQLVTEYIIYPFLNITDYQIKLSGVPSFSKEDVLVILNKKILPHWVESKGSVWTKIPELKKNTPLKLYTLTGNPSAASASNGKNIFVQWKGATTTAYLESLVIPPTPLIFEARVKRDADTDNIYFGISNNANMQLGDNLRIQAEGNNRYGAARNNGTQSYVTATPGLTGSTFYKLKIVRYANTSYYYVDAVQLSTPITTNLPDENMGLAVYVYSGTFGQTYSFVRKYISPEPIVQKVRTLNKSLLLKELMR